MSLWVIIVIIILLIIIYVLIESGLHYHGSDLRTVMTSPVCYPEPNKNELKNIIDKSLIIGVPGYNINVPLLRYRLNKLSIGFKKATYVIYGLDSSNEQTINDLKIWKEEDNRLILHSAYNLSSLDRTVKLGLIRNFIRAKIQQDEHDYVLIYDGDHQGEMSKNGLIQAIKLLESKSSDVVCAYGTVNYGGFDFLYDSYAIRFKSEKTHNRANRLRMWMTKFADDIIEVNSGFSGAALYRWDDYIQYSYSEKADFCEHVGLHAQMKKDGKKIVIYKPFCIHVGCQ